MIGDHHIDERGKEWIEVDSGYEWIIFHKIPKYPGGPKVLGVMSFVRAKRPDETVPAWARTLVHTAS